MQCLPQRGLEFHNEKLPPFQGPPTVPRGCFIPPCGWSFILEVNSSSTEFAGQAGQNWTFMSWYWAKSHLSNMDSGLIVLQHAVPSTKRSGISQRQTFVGAKGEPRNLLLRALHKTGIWESFQKNRLKAYTDNGRFAPATVKGAWRSAGDFFNSLFTGKQSTLLSPSFPN